MKITKLELTHFGKFQNKTLFFQDGCNLIYGENEAGKTTIHTFIYGMLFGLDPSRGRGTKNSLYTRYIPWQTPEAYSGKLWFQRGGCSYRIERCFLKDRRSLHVIDETHGKELEPAEEQLAALLAPLTEVTFRNTLLIRQMQILPEADFANQLENYMANLTMAKTASVDLKAAQDQLSKMQRSMKRTLQPGLLSKKMELEAEQAQLQKEIHELTDSHRIQSEKLEVARAAASLTMQPGTAESSHPQSSGSQARPESPAQDLQTNQKKPLSPVPGILLYILSLLSAGCEAVILLTHRYMDYLFAFLGVTWAALILALLYDAVRHFRNRKSSQALQPDSSQDSIKPIPKKKEPVLSASDTDQPSSGDSSGCQQNSADAAEQQEALIREQTRLELELAQKRTHLEQTAEKLRAVDQALSRDQATKKELEALDIAIQRLEQLSQQIHHSYGTDLNQDTSALLSRLTHRLYTKLTLDPDLHITLNTADRLIPAEQLSRGTLEQVYFCLRIAAAQMLSPEEPFPFLLDDVFVYYDDQRIHAALELLKDLDTQVILFSCHKREQNIMKTLLQQ